jgi:hypothetical protein
MKNKKPQLIQGNDAPLVPIKDKDLLTKFLNQPFTKIAEAVTGAISVGQHELLVASGRLVQGALKGNFFKQFGCELDGLMKKGRIAEDYADEKFGFQTFTELLKFIDEEDVDVDRLHAVKAMFYAVNKMGKPPGMEVLNYQLFKLSKKISASQLLLLQVLKKLSNTVDFDDQKNTRIRCGQWSQIVAKEIGHGIATIVTQDAEVLETLGFLEPKEVSDAGRNIFVIPRLNAGLSDLGMVFCDHLQEYEKIVAAD